MPEATATEPVVEPTSTEPQAPVEQVEPPSPAVPATFQVKVGGETMEVTLEEALQGYQRQEDYTRKTQALAQEREHLSQAQQLWNAIESNPEYTISAIAEAYGYKLSPAEQRAAEAARGGGEAANPFEEAGSDADKADPRWDRVEQFMQQQSEREVQAQIDRELQSIHNTYGVAFDDNQLIQFAVDNGIANLDAAFKAWSFDAAGKVAQNRQIQARKSGAPPVAGGHGVQAGAVAPGSGSKFMSIAEAFAAAEAEQNG